MDSEFQQAIIAADGRCSWLDNDPDEPIVRWSSMAAVADDYWLSSVYREPSRAARGDDSMVPAVRFVNAVVQVGDPRSVDLIQALVDTAASDQELDYVGAGPLEDLLSHHGHGLQFVNEIERRARQQARFRMAVSGLWLSNSVPPCVSG